MIKVTSKYMAEPGLGPRSLQELLPRKQEVSVDPVSSSPGCQPGAPHSRGDIFRPFMVGVGKGPSPLGVAHSKVIKLEPH